MILIKHSLTFQKSWKDLQFETKGVDACVLGLQRIRVYAIIVVTEQNREVAQRGGRGRGVP